MDKITKWICNVYDGKEWKEIETDSLDGIYNKYEYVSDVAGYID